MALEQFERNEQLATGDVNGERLEQSGNRVGDAGVARERRDAFSGSPEDARRQRDQAAGYTFAIAFQLGQRPHRFIVEIEAARIDHGHKAMRRQRIPCHGRPQCRRHRICIDLAAAGSDEHIAPPLQPDFPRQRLARRFAHARDLQVEGIQRTERAAVLGRREQGREIAVLVGRPNQRLAMAECIVHARVMPREPGRLACGAGNCALTL